MVRNKFGNIVEHGFNGHPDRDRYWYDFGDGLPGERSDWRQYDTEQDAHYFGVWINLKTRQTFCYAEGDTTLVTCDDDAGLALELKAMEEFHGSPPPTIRTISDDGQLTEHFVARPSIENPSPAGFGALLHSILEPMVEGDE